MKNRFIVEMNHHSYILWLAMKNYSTLHFIFLKSSRRGAALIFLPQQGAAQKFLTLQI